MRRNSSQKVFAMKCETDEVLWRGTLESQCWFCGLPGVRVEYILTSGLSPLFLGIETY